MSEYLYKIDETGRIWNDHGEADLRAFYDVRFEYRPPAVDYRTLVGVVRQSPRDHVFAVKIPALNRAYLKHLTDLLDVLEPVGVGVEVNTY